MASVLAQAHLQRRLLFALSDGPAVSTVDAARRADASRVSASRSLHNLLDRGLVEKRGRAWLLTDTGKAAVAELRGEASSDGAIRLEDMLPRWRRQLGLDSTARLYAAVDAMRGPVHASTSILDMVRRIEKDRAASASAVVSLGAVGASGLGTGVANWANVQASLLPSAAPFSAFAGSIAQIDRSYLPVPTSLMEFSKRLTEQAAYPSALEGVAKRFEETLAMPGIIAAARLAEPSIHWNKAMRAAVETVRIGATGSIGAALSEAMAAQRTQLDALSIGTGARAWWAPLIAETLQPTAGLVSDLSAIDGLIGSRRELVRRLGAPLSIASAGLVAAHRRHMTAALGELAPAPVAYADAARQSVLIPTRGSAAYVGGVRRLLEPPPRRPTEPDVDTDARTLALAERLSAIHPLLGEMLLGAWERLRDGGHDWSRQAAQSGREVLTQTLARLAPDAPPDPAAQNKVTHAARVRHLLAGSDTLANLAEAQVNAVDTTYRLLVAEAHEHDASRVNRDGMAGVLRSVEAVLWIVVSIHPRDGGAL